MAQKFIFVNVDGDYQESAGAYEQSDFINASAGAGDAGKPVVLDANGQIDASMINFGAIDHSSLLNLGNDDHTQYILVNGGRAFSANQSMGNFQLKSVAPGTIGTDAVNLDQLNAKFNGLDWKDSARVSSVANVSIASAPATIDGITLVSGDRVLLKDQTLGQENGIYVFNGTGSALTRSLDADQNVEVTANMTISVSEGTINADKIYTLSTNDPITVGTTPLVFELVPFNTFLGGNGISITGQTIDADILPAGGLEFTGGQLAVNTLDLDGVGLIGDGDLLAIDFSTAFNDQKAIAAQDLNSVVNGEGASIVGIEDAAGNFTATNVEGALGELYTLATVQYDQDVATAGATIAAGDLLYFSADNTVSPMPINAVHRAVGIALASAATSAQVSYVRYDEVIPGAVSGASAGTQYYWDGSILTTTMPTAAGAYVWKIGIAKNATDILAAVEFIKRNA